MRGLVNVNMLVSLYVLDLVERGSRCYSCCPRRMAKYGAGACRWCPSWGTNASTGDIGQKRKRKEKRKLEHGSAEGEGEKQPADEEARRRQQQSKLIQQRKLHKRGPSFEEVWPSASSRARQGHAIEVHAGALVARSRWSHGLTDIELKKRVTTFTSQLLWHPRSSVVKRKSLRHQVGQLATFKLASFNALPSTNQPRMPYVDCALAVVSTASTARRAGPMMSSPLGEVGRWCGLLAVDE